MTKEDALQTIDASEVCPGQSWLHGKTGRRYTVIATGIDEATLAPVVIYAGPDGIVWVRALSVFLGEKDGQPRFMHVSQDDEAHTAPFQRAGWRPTDGFEEHPQ